MELLLHILSHGRLVYRPFPKERGHANPTFNTPRTLQDLCYRTVIKEATLSSLKESDLPMLPPLIRHQLTKLSTRDFVELDCAPFLDLFDIYMYHRGLTYRVRCTVDGGVYMATHVGTYDSVEQNSETFWQWVELSHPNLMCAYAVAVDEDTSNVFLITELPDTTLKRLEIFLASQGLCFPEYFLWKVAKQLSSVIMYIEKRQLSFGRFDLKNIHLVGNRLLLDNQLTMKSCVDALPIRGCVQSTFLGDTVNMAGYHELRGNSPSSAPVMYLGVVLTRLASIAMTDLNTSSTSTDVSELGTTSPSMWDDVPFFDGFRPAVAADLRKYSNDFLDLLGLLNSENKPALSSIHDKAVEMMALLAARECMARLDFGDEDSHCATQ